MTRDHASESAVPVPDIGSDEIVPCCLAGVSPGYLSEKLDALDDEEGESVPRSLPSIIDAHVHLFPDKVFEALWRWFEAHGWPIRYRLYSDDVVRHLLDRGVEAIVGLHYAHKPGIAESLNEYMAGLCRRYPQVAGAATVFPGEPDARAILERGFAAGLGSVKLHCHVQCFALDDPALVEVYEVCAVNDRPLVIHAGREPRSEAYACDPYELCDVGRVERVLEDHPDLRLVVPHLGADEFADYAQLTHRYDNLWLDTTMMLSEFFSIDELAYLDDVRPDRLLYGTDFPNIPYAWDRELRWLAESGWSPERLAAVCSENARSLYEL